MNSSSIPDYRPQWQQLLQQAGLSSLSALSQKAGISTWELARLQRGLLPQTRLEILIKVSQALGISLAALIETFAPELSASGKTDSLRQVNLQADLQGECDRLQRQLEEQHRRLQEEFQRDSIQVLESWLIQWPTVVQRVQENPELTANKVLSLLRPLEELLKHWGVVPIARVGEIVPYDPRVHQLSAGTAQAGEPVRVRYIGYGYQDQLLYRAQVSPVAAE
ncbi:MAG: helix-turn-helix domain-containing protein [Oscillatoriales cyanobacterium RM2_1_1]|nr:helix-turn-helix domain-containing protein [Oscillatoriales cyanobacterium SM2_3_0]NJO46853.1 helix-turn-helix domain-containing protein [Oscillatoriales cyanobacterium RM2_1_1]